MTSQYVCTKCGHVGTPVRITKGSIGIEIILWLFLLIPGIIYSIWRLTTRYNACQVCKSAEIIPVDSPVGKKLLADQVKLQ